MKTNPLMLSFQLTVRLPEIIIFLLGALVLGFTIHYFWSARKTIKIVKPQPEEGIDENDNWKLKYYNDMDHHEKTLQQLRDRMAEAEENEQIMGIEVDEVRAELKETKLRCEQAEAMAKPPTSSEDYLNELKSAQDNLFQYNQHINRLLQQIQALKESERKYQELLGQNAQLNTHLLELRKQVSEKDAEIGHMQQQQRLSAEVNDRMDKAFSEFGVLQEKLQKLEGYLDQPHSRKIEYDQLHESYFKLTREFDEVKTKQLALWDENQRMSRILADTEDKLKEANFQRLQLLKKTQFLEELNKDLQEATEHHKKMESQLKRISEMESFLSNALSIKKDFPGGQIPG